MKIDVFTYSEKKYLSEIDSPKKSCALGKKKYLQQAKMMRSVHNLNFD